MFISISGLIGAGKTTLAEELAKEMGFPVYYEPVEDNIYLEDFYKDMKTYGFPCRFTYSTNVTNSTSKSSGVERAPYRIDPYTKTPSLRAFL